MRGYGNYPPGYTAREHEAYWGGEDKNVYRVERLIANGPDDCCWEEYEEFGPYEGALTDAKECARRQAPAKVIHFDEDGHFHTDADYDIEDREVAS